MKLFKLAEDISGAFFPASSSLVMGAGMNSVLEEFKIFRSIVGFYSVFMMNNEFHIRLDKPADFFLHYKTVFWNIAHAISVRMRWVKDINITGSLSFATIPEFWILQTMMNHVPKFSARGNLCYS